MIQPRASSPWPSRGRESFFSPETIPSNLDSMRIFPASTSPILLIQSPVAIVQVQAEAPRPDEPKVYERSVRAVSCFGHPFASRNISHLVPDKGGKFMISPLVR